MNSPGRPLKIFVSSTARDLGDHRNAVKAALERSGEAPELFEYNWSARPDPLVKECRAAAEKADLVVVIVGHCYGTRPTQAQGGDGEKSVTWEEYEAATGRKVPVLAFVVDDDPEWKGWTHGRDSDRLGTEFDNPEAVLKDLRSLKAFKDLLEEDCTPSRFREPSDLAVKVLAAISSLRRDRLPGDVPTPALPEGLAALSMTQRRALVQHLEGQIRQWQLLPLAALDDTRGAKDGQGVVLDDAALHLTDVYVELNVSEPRPKDSVEERSAMSPALLREQASDADGAEEPPGDREGQNVPETLSPDHGSRQGPWTAEEAVAHHLRVVLLGQPGSGKSTFVKMLCIALASRVLTALGTPTVCSGRLDQFAQRLGPPLVPVYVTVRDFAPALATGDGPDPIFAQVTRMLCPSVGGGERFSELVGPLQQMLAAGEALLVLDGLDEIGELDHRDRVVKVIQKFARENPRTRVVVTCRVAAYDKHEGEGGEEGEEGVVPAARSGEADFRLSKTLFPTVRLQDLAPAQRDRFVEAWYHVQARIGSIKDDPALRAAELQQRIQRRALAKLAGKPILLTIIALIDLNGGRLPDERVLLYKRAAEVLMIRWKHGRGVQGPSGRDSASGKGASEELDVSALLRDAAVDLGDGALMDVLSEIALNVHATVDKDEADIAEDVLKASLVKLHGIPMLADNWADRLLKALRHRSGLLIEKEIGVFAFPHRSFQEYFAARGQLAQRGVRDVVEAAMAMRVAPNDIWREVILMIGGCCAHEGAGIDTGINLAERLFREATKPGATRSVEDLLLAVDLLVEMRSYALFSSLKGSELQQALAKHLGGKHGGMLDASLPIRVRAALGSGLGRLGDLRWTSTTEGVNRAEGKTYPTIALADVIEASVFPMGNDSKRTEPWMLDESPRFAARIESPFRVGRYPVTVGEYAHFIAAGGYDRRCDEFWTRAGLQWRQTRGIARPGHADEIFQTPNHPQVGVSWYEAVAFCRWLSHVSGLGYRLPTEMEWERAARHVDGRTWPWGEASSTEDVKSKANVNWVIEHTSAVGLFPEGASPCGALDMAGNVWEWCQSEARPDYKDYPRASTLDDDESEHRRVLRGGSWLYLPGFVRCASRSWQVPVYRGLNVGFRVCVCPCSPSDL